MIRRKTVIPTFAILLAASAAADAQTVTREQLAPNAALKYWHACAAFPQLSDEEDQFLDRWYKEPLEDMAVDLIRRGDYALKYLHRGAALKQCVWGIDLEADGCRAKFFHCAKTRQLARLALLRARYRFEQGDAADGVADVLAELKLARHIGAESERAITYWIVAAWMEDNMPGIDLPMAVSLLARYLPTMDKAALVDLKASIATLPPRKSLEQAFRGEGAYLVSFREEIGAMADADNLSAALAELMWYPDPGADADDVLAACGGTVEGLLAAVDKADDYLDQTARLTALPPAEGQRASARLWEEVQAAGPLVSVLVPNATWMIHAEQRLNVRHAALLTAIDILLEGPDAVSRSKDPSSDGPFSYQALPDGRFALISAWPDDETGKGGDGRDSYVSLTVGQETK